jgi:hypothetical protein
MLCPKTYGFRCNNPEWDEMAKEHEALGDPEPWDGMFPGERRMEMEADNDGMIRRGYENPRFEGESDEDFTSDEQEDAEFMGKGGGELVAIPCTGNCTPLNPFRKVPGIWGVAHPKL